MAGPESLYSNQRQPELVPGGDAPPESAQGYAGGRYEPVRQAAHPVPPKLLYFLGAPAARRWYRSNAEILRSPQPDQLAQPRLDDQPDQSKRVPGNDQPGPGFYSCG